jgi:hypothetical protein
MGSTFDSKTIRRVRTLGLSSTSLLIAMKRCSVLRDSKSSIDLDRNDLTNEGLCLHGAGGIGFGWLGVDTCNYMTDDLKIT